LREAGVAPEDIDVVLCTHLHVDHVGWNTRLENGHWVPTFPNARYLIARREWDYWQSAGSAALARTGDYIADSVLPIFAAGQAELIGDEHALAGDISLEPAPGHTPGLMMMRLGAGGGQAILSSDLMHHPLQIRYPEWSTRFCVDPQQARQTRMSFLNEHANSGRLIFPTHFPSPTGCTIERDGKAYRVIFDGERGA
jgi:glyoxylase-like metal-dependent hydrolase (beta-lactamase superfamily II)